jgi:hypothetical protein
MPPTARARRTPAVSTVERPVGRKRVRGGNVAAYAPGGGMAAAVYTGFYEVGNTTVTRGFSEYDRDFFRPDTAIPTHPIEVLHAVFQAYERFGLVRNIIDMMADFTVKGIDIVNEVPRAQRFAREWFARVGGRDRSERIAHMLCLAGVAVVRRQEAKLPAGWVRPAASVRATRSSPLAPGHIPFGYDLSDPRHLSPPDDFEPTASPPVSRFSVFRPADDSRGPAARTFSLFGRRGGEVEDAEQHPLDEKADQLLFYKRFDHQPLPRPITYPILRNLRLLAKLELADEMALDGAVSETVLWRLGRAEGSRSADWVYPTEPQMERLSELLSHSAAGGRRDIVWGFDLEADAIQSSAHNFLGDKKYEPTRKAICHGYGVPMGLLGDVEGGYTNNAVSMKTMTERLEYVRSVVREFWERELEYLQLALGFRKPFRVVFDLPSLSDDAAEKKLLLDLFDRGVITFESIRDRFRFDAGVEETRARREARERKRGKSPAKAGPFTTEYQRDRSNEADFVRQGRLSPSQVGLAYDPPDPDEQGWDPGWPGDGDPEDDGGPRPPSRNQEKRGAEELPAQPEGRRKKKRGRPGRPLGAEDTVPRKRKRVVPVGAAAGGHAEPLAVRLARADRVFADVVALARPHVLAAAGKDNMRKLTAAEAAAAEDTFFAAFCAVGPVGPATKERVAAAIAGAVPVPAAVAEAAAAAVRAAGPDADLATVRRVRAAAVLDAAAAA